MVNGTALSEGSVGGSAAQCSDCSTVSSAITRTSGGLIRTGEVVARLYVSGTSDAVVWPFSAWSDRDRKGSRFLWQPQWVKKKKSHVKAAELKS